MLLCAKTALKTGLLLASRAFVPSIAAISPIVAAGMGGLAYSSSAVAQIMAESQVSMVAGLEAPGIPGATIASLGVPSINSRGAFVIVGTLAGANITAANNQALWLVTPNSVSLVVQSGSPVVQGLPAGLTISSMEFPTLNANGTIAFLTLLQGPGVTGANTRAIIAGSAGVLRLIARAGNPPPGLATTLRYNSFSAPRLGSGNLIIYNASLAGQELNSSGVLRPMSSDAAATMWGGQIGATMGLLIRAGTNGFVPGLPTSKFANFGDANVSEQGILTFHGSLILQNPIVTATTDMVIVRGPVGGFATAARAGMIVPGLVGSGTVRLDGINPVSANGADEFAFTGTVTPSPTASSSFTTYRITNNQWQALAQTGMIVAPGVQVGTISSPRCSGQSNVLILSTLTGASVGPANDQALWASITSGLYQIARKGQQVPGLASGVAFTGFTSYGINAVGTAVFLCSVAGPGVTAASDTALVSWNDVDGLRLIGRKGGTYQVAVDDFRTISAIVCNLDSGAEDGRPASLSSNGLLAFNLNFTDATNASVRAFLIRCIGDIATDSLDTFLNPNGSVGPEDLDAFVSGFISGSSITDIATDGTDTSRNPNGSVGPEDLDAFIGGFLRGC